MMYDNGDIEDSKILKASNVLTMIQENNKT